MQIKQWIPALLGIGILGAGAPKVNSDDLKARELFITKVDQPIVIDGELNDAAWASAAATDHFLEIQPGDNVQPPYRTEVKLTYDNDYLYVGFIAESKPEEIRASVQKRDRVWDDDFISIIIDTYGDANSAVMIGANPFGIQLDALNKGDDDEDEDFDIIFDSKGKITDSGYQVEMAIPFTSLSFPKRSIQEWKVTFFRNLPRNNRHMIVWGGLDRSNQCWLCQMGSLKGIEGITQKGRVEFLPTVVGSQSSEMMDGSMVDSDPFGEGSLGIKYSFSSDRNAEVTINPDFSQVEADEEQVDVNTTFALFFPEKRPFFNEGADLFDTEINVVYTRSINNPITAGRIINRGQNHSWSILSALDEDSPYIVPGEERSYSAMGGRSLSNIVRYKRSLENASFFGVLATNRKMLDNNGSGTVVGVDGRYRHNDMYQLEFQTLLSQTQEPHDSLLVSGNRFGDDHSFTFDGESFQGNAVRLSGSRRTESWNLEYEYNHSTPTFRAENGFITGNNRQQHEVKSFWFGFPDGFISKYVAGFMVSNTQNMDGVQKERFLVSFFNLDLPRQTGVNLMYGKRFQYRFKDTELNGLYDLRLQVNSQINKRVRLGFSISQHNAPVRFLSVPEEGKFFTHGLWSRFQASDKLNLGFSYNYQKMTTMNQSEEYFSGYTSVGRINYQFNESLGIKVLGQYNDFSNSFIFQPLLTYQPSPFTIFYIGSSQNQEVNTISVDAFRDGRLNTRQYFMKFQYLFN